MRIPDKAAIAIALAFTCLVLLPFINKPFNVDDPFYLKMAQHIRTDPLHPYSFKINWSGEMRDAWQSGEANFPPLVPYYIAFVMAMSGSQEWVLHCAFLIFPVIAVLSFYFIARKYCKDPLLPTLLFAATPVFSVSATSIMLDIPLVAFMVCAVALFIYGVDRNNPAFLAGAGIFTGGALLIKYTAAILIPMLLLYLFLEKKINYAAYMLIPIGIFAGWCIHNYAIYNDLHFLKSIGYGSNRFSLHKLIAFNTFFSGAMIFPAFVVFLMNKKELLLSLAPVTISVILAFVATGNFFVSLAIAALCFATIAFLYKVSVMSGKLPVFILAWLALSLFVILGRQPWIAGRYILLALPPAVILWQTMQEKIFAHHRLAAAGLICTLFCGLPVVYADYQWAKGYKDFAAVLQEKGYNSGYILGHGGFQYYLEKAGMSELEIDKSVEPKSYIIISRQLNQKIPGNLPFTKMYHVGTLPIGGGLPVRVMNHRAAAGFHASFWGIFPFTFSQIPMDEIAIYQYRGHTTMKSQGRTTPVGSKGRCKLINLSVKSL